MRPRSTRGSTASGHRARIVLAFFAIYVVWGSTYLAIRVAVETVPPLFAAGVRFAIAGTVLFVWARMHGALGPSRRQWRNLTLLGALMFLLTYGGLFWAEKSVPSGIASVLVATVPLWTKCRRCRGSPSWPRAPSPTRSSPAR